MSFDTNPNIYALKRNMQKRISLHRIMHTSHKTAEYFDWFLHGVIHHVL